MFARPGEDVVVICRHPGAAVAVVIGKAIVDAYESVDHPPRRYA